MPTKALDSVSAQSKTRQIMYSANPYYQNLGHVNYLLFSQASGGLSCEQNVWPIKQSCQEKATGGHDLASDKTPAILRTIKNEQDFPSGFQYVYVTQKSFLGETKFYY